jgi:hypothetical protein
MTGQCQLLEIVAALHPVRGLANLLDSWKNKADKDADDGNDHQQLNQRERPPASAQACNNHEKLSEQTPKANIPGEGLTEF